MKKRFLFIIIMLFLSVLEGYCQDVDPYFQVKTSQRVYKMGDGITGEILLTDLPQEVSSKIKEGHGYYKFIKDGDKEGLIRLKPDKYSSSESKFSFYIPTIDKFKKRTFEPDSHFNEFSPGTYKFQIITDNWASDPLELVIVEKESIFDVQDFETIESFLLEERVSLIKELKEDGIILDLSKGIHIVMKGDINNDGDDEYLIYYNDAETAEANVSSFAYRIVGIYKKENDKFENIYHLVEDFIRQHTQSEWYRDIENVKIDNKIYLILGSGKSNKWFDTEELSTHYFLWYEEDIKLIRSSFSYFPRNR